ncbi:MAG: metallophosphoesterase [Candidatus Woesearchaeota archaeon]
MKALLFSDIHGSRSLLSRILKEARGAEAMFCCGDITNFQKGLEGILKKLDSAGIPIFIVPGNHESPEHLELLCQKFENVKNIHKKFLVYDKFLIMGYGSGGFTLRDAEFKRVAEEFARAIKINKERRSIFVTHAPPYGTRLDVLNGMHVGSRDISDFIRHNRVDLLFCGHLHENSGIIEQVGRTTVINPGKLMKVEIK